MTRLSNTVLGTIVAVASVAAAGSAFAQPRQVNCNSAQAKYAAKYLFENRTPTVLPGHRGRDAKQRLMNPWRVRGGEPTHGTYRGSLHREAPDELSARALGYSGLDEWYSRQLAVDIDLNKTRKVLGGASARPAFLTPSDGIIRYRAPWLAGIFDTTNKFPTRGDWTPMKAENITKSRKLLLELIPKKHGFSNTPDWRLKELLLNYMRENRRSPAVDISPYHAVRHNSSFLIPSRAWHGSEVLIKTFGRLYTENDRSLDKVSFAWSKRGWADVTVSACMYAIQTKELHTTEVYGMRVKSIEAVRQADGYKTTTFLSWSGETGIKTMFDVYRLGDQGFRHHDDFETDRYLFTVVSLQSKSSMPVSTKLNFYFQYSRD